MKRLTLSADTVKLIALASMTADHAEKVFTSAGVVSHTVGRMAFPLFAFLLIRHFWLYHPIKKYVLRLGIFGLATSLILTPFAPEVHNVLFTFLWGIVFLSAAEFICAQTHSLPWQGYWIGWLFLIMFPLIMKADYSFFGFCFLLALYAYNRAPNFLNKSAVLVTGIVMNAGDILSAVSSALIILGLLSWVNIEAGKRLIKGPFFYIYYPLHRLLLYSLKVLI